MGTKNEMKLRQSIRRVLKEERRFSRFVNRRLPLDEINGYFRGVVNKLIGLLASEEDTSKKMERDEFKQFVVNYTVNYIM